MRVARQLSLAVVLNGIRWANNILVEILSNHARNVDDIGADLLRDAVSKLREAEARFRLDLD